MHEPFYYDMSAGGPAVEKLVSQPKDPGLDVCPVQRVELQAEFCQGDLRWRLSCSGVISCPRMKTVDNEYYIVCLITVQCLHYRVKKVR